MPWGERHHATGLFDEHALRRDIVKMWGEHGAHADVYDTLYKQYIKMRDALRALEQWDMLSLDDKGHGVATADASWARALIVQALGGG